MSYAIERAGFVGKSPIRVGRFTYGFENISIKEWGEGAALTIGSFCSIASSITIFLGGNHRLDWITTFPFGHIFQEELGGADIQGHPATKGDVIIGNDVWIGHGTSIMSGVSIGSGAVIAANSNVVKDVMPYEIVGGNPAKVIKNRFCKEITGLLLTLEWWSFPVEIIKQINKDLSAEPTIDALINLIKRYKI
jgi:acetyltransferase-like isoleucine patch superfamily enzyme